MRRAIYLCLSLLAAMFVTTLRGEVFVLKSGGRVEGELLNPERQPEEPYRLRTDEGLRLALADSAVLRVIVKTDVDKQYEELLPTLENTADAQWSMAEWCKEAGLIDERKRHLQAVIALAPEHAEARKALGYQRYGSQWLTQEEHMLSLGYSKYKGAWRLKQEIEIDSRKVQQELTEKKLRKDIRMWFEQVASGGRLSDSADRNLSALNDPAAVPALAEILGDAQQPKATRRRCLEILTKLPPGLATPTLVRIALNDPDANLQYACLDELKRVGAATVLPAFVARLKSKDNNQINRAADCIARLGDKSATLPLINSLVTEHKFLVQQGNTPPGGMSATFSPGGSGSGGLSMGGKLKEVKQRLQNSSVLGALATLYPGTNYRYDIDAWRAWYSEEQTTSSVDLRRGE